MLNNLKIGMMENDNKGLKFYQPNVAIQYGNKEEFFAICGKCEEFGVLILGMPQPTGYYVGGWVIDIFRGENGGKGLFLEKGYTIVPFAEFMEANTKPEEAPNLPRKNLEGVQVGDRLFHSLLGVWMVVLEVEPKKTFALTVRNENESSGEGWFTMEGYLTEIGQKNGGLPILYFSRPEFEYPTRPVAEVVYEVDKPICYKRTRNGPWRVGVLSQIRDGRYWIYSRSVAVFEVKPFEAWKSENLNESTDENDD